ncbi:MAG: hypothetical protein JSW71_06100 [Gemmatimonadota bacterium]|nr:MAG: hypothetical protein JSW71_06100 [Gemmatimonadota bacterium]
MNVGARLMVILATAFLAALATPLIAAPSFLGYTGLVQVPTADALGEDDYNLVIFTLNLEEGADSNIYAANLGLAEGLEVGFARHSPEDATGETFLNAKYTFSRETEANPAMAVGVMDLTDEVDTTVYVVLSKALERRYDTRYGEIGAPRLHFGVGGGQLDGVFGGLSAVLGDRLLLMAEYDGSDVNFGARLAIGNNVRAHVGALDGLDDIGLGVSFNKTF